MDNDNENESSSTSDIEYKELREDPSRKEMKDSLYQDLPQYVLELFKRDGFKNLFLTKNQRYLTKGYIDYLPDFGTLEKDGKYWHGKMFWRYVGWDIGKKYTGEMLRAIRKKNGVGHNKMKAAHAKEEKTHSPLSG